MHHSSLFTLCIVDQYSSKCFRLMTTAIGFPPHVAQLDLKPMNPESPSTTEQQCTNALHPKLHQPVCITGLAALQIVDQYSRKSFRLMAIAVGFLPHVAQLDLKRMSQQQVEEHTIGFNLIGLIVLTNSVRADSKEFVLSLQQK